MYNVKTDYITRLRYYFLNSASLLLSEDPVSYVDSYDSSLLQGFLVWNHSAYIAKEYVFSGVERVDFFVIPTFGGLAEETTCGGLQYVGINIDVHKDIDSTGQRMDMIVREVKRWHRRLLVDGICPISLSTKETYMILPNGTTPTANLTDVPYTRCTVKYKLDFLNPLSHG